MTSNLRDLIIYIKGVERFTIQGASGYLGISVQTIIKHIWALLDDSCIRWIGRNKAGEQVYEVVKSEWYYLAPVG